MRSGYFSRSNWYLFLSFFLALGEGFLGFVPNKNGEMASYYNFHAFVSGFWLAVFVFQMQALISKSGKNTAAPVD